MLYRTDEEAADDRFEVDLQDSRFGAVLDGTNPNYGIDPLSNEYRPTDAMKKILTEQQNRRRIARDSKDESIKTSGDLTESATDINKLVSKLNAKSSNGSRKRLRGAM